MILPWEIASIRPEQVTKESSKFRLEFSQEFLDDRDSYALVKHKQDRRHTFRHDMTCYFMPFSASRKAEDAIQ
jgi:hypothetical protein